jgi:hypothetical protein
MASFSATVETDIIVQARAFECMVPLSAIFLSYGALMQGLFVSPAEPCGSPRARFRSDPAQPCQAWRPPESLSVILQLFVTVR